MNLNSLHFPYISKAIALYFEPHLVILNSLHFRQKSKAIALHLESSFNGFDLTSFSINIKGYSLIFGVKFY